jgi:hopanoid biosynthesis associated protein HpnK
VTAPSVQPIRKLIVNADDFGFTTDVNEGIIEAHEKGILTATTLMANGEAFDHAVRLAKQTPTLDVGCHLVLVGGISLLPPFRHYPATVGQLMRELFFYRISVHAELNAQVRRIIAAGIQPTHLDTHKHTHLLPPVLEAVAKISAQYGIPWVRRPFDYPITGGPKDIPWLARNTSRGLQFLRTRFHRTLHRYRCQTTDHFAGFQFTGHLRTAQLIHLIRNLPPGITELMCHPGRYGRELRAARTRLKHSRERELEALTAPEVKAALAEEGVQLVRYRDLPV